MWPHCGKNSTCLFSVDVAHFKERCSWFFSLDVANVEIKYTWIVFCVARFEIETSIWFLDVVHCEKDYTCSTLWMWRTVKRTLYRFSSWMWRTVKRTLPCIIYGYSARCKNLYLGTLSEKLCLSSLCIWRTVRRGLRGSSLWMNCDDSTCYSLWVWRTVKRSLPGPVLFCGCGEL
jgi:hypothetical protein